MDFGHTEPLYEYPYPYECRQKCTSFLVYVRNQLFSETTTGNKPPRSAAKNALLPDAVAPLIMVNTPGTIFTSKGPSSNFGEVESPVGIPGHRNTALEKPMLLLSSKCRGSTGAESEQAQSSTSSSCKKVSMRCMET